MKILLEDAQPDVIHTKAATIVSSTDHMIEVTEDSRGMLLVDGRAVTDDAKIHLLAQVNSQAQEIDNLRKQLKEAQANQERAERSRNESLYRAEAAKERLVELERAFRVVVSKGKEGFE